MVAGATVSESHRPDPSNKGAGEMTRTIEAEMTVRTNSVQKAIEKFFGKHPELDYWKEMFEYMAENNVDHESDEWFDKANRVRNTEWTWALHLDIEDGCIYLCVIERA